MNAPKAQPTLSPYAAIANLQADPESTFMFEEFCYSLGIDYAPVAEDMVTGTLFFVEGNIGDEVNENSTWIS